MAMRESALSTGPLRQGRLRLRFSPKRCAARVFARMAGLPISLRHHHVRLHQPAAVVRLAYARRFWAFHRPAELIELVVGLLLTPAVLLSLSLWFLWKNGALVASEHQRPIHSQFADHLRLYFGAGVLPPWYYIYELYRRPLKRHARGFIYRWESKNGVMALLKERRPPISIVSDKLAFAEHCRRAGVATVPILGHAKAGEVRWLSEDAWTDDWFVKPVDGKGGKGIERWVRISPDRLCGADGQPRPQDEVVRHLAERSRSAPCIVQPRVRNHPDLADLNNGALATVRALTCLDEAGAPELVGAVLRMAIGGNHVVDNLHAGGIAAGIDLDTGCVGPATNLGANVRLGWLDRHPMTGAAITGRRLPFADRLKPFAEAAHRAFADRVVVGWDIAIVADGLLLVEANGAPDLDIMQRPFRRGLMRDRLGQLLAFHLGNQAAAA